MKKLILLFNICVCICLHISAQPSAFNLQIAPGPSSENKNLIYGFDLIGAGQQSPMQY